MEPCVTQCFILHILVSIYFYHNRYNWLQSLKRRVPLVWERDGLGRIKGWAWEASVGEAWEVVTKEAGEASVISNPEAGSWFFFGMFFFCCCCCWGKDTKVAAEVSNFAFNHGWVWFFLWIHFIHCCFPFYKFDLYCFRTYRIFTSITTYYQPFVHFILVCFILAFQ